MQRVAARCSSYVGTAYRRVRCPTRSTLVRRMNSMYVDASRWTRRWRSARPEQPRRSVSPGAHRVCERCRLLVAEAARAVMEVDRDAYRVSRADDLAAHAPARASRSPVATASSASSPRGDGRGLRGVRSAAAGAGGAQDLVAHRAGRRPGHGAVDAGGAAGPPGDPPQRLPHSRVRLPCSRRLARARAAVSDDGAAGRRDAVAARWRASGAAAGEACAWRQMVAGLAAIHAPASSTAT